MNYKQELELRIQEIEQLLQEYLPKVEGYQKTVIEAMHYSVLSGGKRLRSILMHETWKLFGGTGEMIRPFMAAMEMLHSYSLVHDDLPCMDDDEYRRGRKTTHIVYGEGMAVLAGDALLNFAFETAIHSFDQAKNDTDRLLAARALSVFSSKAGIYGMIGGQTADLEAEDMGDAVTEDQLLFIHANKTAALIQASMLIGAILAGAGKEDLEKLERCAYLIGIAFQIQDDILDVTSSLEVLGKQTGSDIRKNKTTYVTLKGIEQAKQDVKQLSEEALAILESFGNETNEFLCWLVRDLITRKK